MVGLGLSFTYSGLDPITKFDSPLISATPPLQFANGNAPSGHIHVSEVGGVTFSNSDSAPVPRFFNPGLDPDPATIIGPTVIYQCFYLITDHADSCYCRIEKWLQIRVRFFPNFWLRIRVRKKNGESCRSRLRHPDPAHLWHMCGLLLSPRPARGLVQSCLVLRLCKGSRVSGCSPCVVAL